MHFLCSHYHSKPQLEALTGKPIPCSHVPVPPYFLNYPFIGIGAMSGHLSFYLTVTFKGRRKDLQIFKVSVDSPPNVDVVEEPEVSDFSSGVKKGKLQG